MKRIISVITVLAMVFCLFGCNANSDNAKQINIVALKGPTGMGMSKMIADKNENYNFSVISDPTMIASYLSGGDADIAACPLNMASVLYNKMNKDIRILAINTLGTLYILDNSGKIKAPSDLKGKKIVTSGRGSTPEYVLNYLLESYNIKDDVEVEYKSEHSEVAAAVLSGEAEVVMLPEPNVSVVTTKNKNINIAIDVTKTIEEKNGFQFAMGCIIAKKSFTEENKKAVEKFLDEYKRSIEYINSSDEAGKIICEAGIIDNESIAQKSIKTSNIVFVDGEKMKDIAQSNFTFLFNSNPKSVGGKLPDESIFYIK